MLKGIRSIFLRLKFSSPVTSSLVIFHKDGSDVLLQTALRGMPYEILDVKRGTCYLSTSLILNFSKNFFCYSNQILDLPIWMWPRFLFGHSFRVYQLSCLQEMRPKVVITYIDNDYTFAWISRRYPNAEFLAVQNGVRSPYDLSSWLPSAPHPANVISFPHFFCYGNYEREIYQEFGHQIDSFHPVGSLRASYYLHELAIKKPAKVTHNICLISQWFPALESGDIATCPEIGPSLSILHDYIRRYCEETDASLCVAMRSATKFEAEYFKHYIGEHVELVYNDRESMSTYFAIDASDVAICLDSTAGREAFGWGKKVLFCNFTGHENYNFPYLGVWALGNSDYEEFKASLDRLFAINADEYKSLSVTCSAQLMSNANREPAYKVIRNIVDSMLTDSFSGNAIEISH